MTKLFALAALLLLAPVAASAQSAPRPLVLERVHSPFVVAPDYKVTDLDGELGQLAGGYAGRLIDDTLFIGGAGYWLANGSNGDGLAYGGLVVGWSMPAGSRIRFGARGLVGGGTGKLGTDIDVLRGGFGGGPNGGAPGGGFGRNTRGPVRFGGGPGQVGTVRYSVHDDFFVFEPQADLVTRLNSHIGLHWAAGYRLTAATDALDDRLNGTTGSVGLQLEW